MEELLVITEANRINHSMEHVQEMKLKLSKLILVLNKRFQNFNLDHSLKSNEARADITQVWNSFGSTNESNATEEKDLERLKADHANEIEQMNERHKEALAESKKKQWVKKLFSQQQMEVSSLTSILSFLFVFFSVSIAKKRRFIGVVGIQHIVLWNANRNIGTGNIK